MGLYRNGNNGQAMTEFLICASFALIPLFLGISLLAKYIDIKQAAIQAARYQAWEYTVWYADNSEPMSGFNAVTQPIKSTTATQKEARLRFFSDPGTETTSGGEKKTLPNAGRQGPPTEEGHGKPQAPPPPPAPRPQPMPR